MAPGNATTSTESSKKRPSTAMNGGAGGGTSNDAAAADRNTAPAATTLKKTKMHNGGTNHEEAIKLERETLHQELDYTPLSLHDVQTQLKEILKRIPRVPSNGFLLPTTTTNDTTTVTTTATSKDDDDDDSKKPTAAAAATTPATTTPPLVVPVPSKPCGYDKGAIKEWAIQMQYCIEQVGYLLPNVSVATYKWGTNRTGAADQNLTLLLTEMARSQDQINTKVSPRLNDILCPVVTILTDKTVTTKSNVDNTTETKQNYFIHTHEDTDYVELCYASLGRNAASIRHLMIANLDKILSALTDYGTADVKDQDSSRDFVY